MTVYLPVKCAHTTKAGFSGSDSSKMKKWLKTLKKKDIQILSDNSEKSSSETDLLKWW